MNCFGPTFGGGHDLSICDKSDIQKNSECNIGFSYDRVQNFGKKE